MKVDEHIWMEESKTTNLNTIKINFSDLMLIKADHIDLITDI